MSDSSIIILSMLSVSAVVFCVFSATSVIAMRKWQQSLEHPIFKARFHQVTFACSVSTGLISGATVIGGWVIELLRLPYDDDFVEAFSRSGLLLANILFWMQTIRFGLSVVQSKNARLRQQSLYQFSGDKSPENRVSSWNFFVVRKSIWWLVAFMILVITYDVLVYVLTSLSVGQMIWSVWFLANIVLVAVVLLKRYPNGVYLFGEHFTLLLLCSVGGALMSVVPLLTRHDRLLRLHAMTLLGVLLVEMVGALQLWFPIWLLRREKLHLATLRKLSHSQTSLDSKQMKLWQFLCSKSNFETYADHLVATFCIEMLSFVVAVSSYRNACWAEITDVVTVRISRAVAGELRISNEENASELDVVQEQVQHLFARNDDCNSILGVSFDQQSISSVFDGALTTESILPGVSVDVSEVIQLANFIHNRFIARGARDEVNVPHQISARISEEMSHLKVESFKAEDVTFLFDDAVLEVYKLMEDIYLTSFRLFLERRQI